MTSSSKTSNGGQIVTEETNSKGVALSGVSVWVNGEHNALMSKVDFFSLIFMFNVTLLVPI